MRSVVVMFCCLEVLNKGGVLIRRSIDVVSISLG